MPAYLPRVMIATRPFLRTAQKPVSTDLQTAFPSGFHRSQPRLSFSPTVTRGLVSWCVVADVEVRDSKISESKKRTRRNRACVRMFLNPRASPSTKTTESKHTVETEPENRGVYRGRLQRTLHLEQTPAEKLVMGRGVRWVLSSFAGRRDWAIDGCGDQIARPEVALCGKGLNHSHKWQTKAALCAPRRASTRLK